MSEEKSGNALAKSDTDLFAGATDLNTALRVAKGFSSSSLVPKEYQGNVANCMIAMEVANRIGASVFAVMQSLDIIHGRPSWRSSFLIATVNACGRFTPLRFRWQGTEGKDDWGCRAYAKDRESDDECVGALITMAMAKAEGWSSKSGSKYKTMPEQMLMYRAAAFWQRVYAPELSLGLHTREEVEDMHGAVVEMPAQLRGGGATALAEKIGLPKPAEEADADWSLEPPPDDVEERQREVDPETGEVA